MQSIGDPEISVLLALHYQNEVLHPDGAIGQGTRAGDARQPKVVANARRLLDAARRLEVPIMHVRIAFAPDHSDVIQNCALFRNVVARGAMLEGSWGAAFHEGLGPLAGEDVILHKRVSAFFGTDLQSRIEALDAGHLIIAGVATHSVVETTARHAADVGWRVTVVEDACSSADPMLHKAALANIALLGDVATTDEIIGRGFRQ